MCVLVCLVPEHRKKSTLLTDSLQVELVCVRKLRKSRQLARTSPLILMFETYRLLGWYGRRYREYALR
jgi:hypothetical protein